MDLKRLLPAPAISFFRNAYRGRGLIYFLYRSCWDRDYPRLCIHSTYWHLRSALTGEPLVHFIGDSHTTPFNFQPGMVVHHIGQATAHNLGNAESSSDSSRQLSIVLSQIDRKRDFVVMVFGEIDCRVHFYYQFMKQKKKAPLIVLMDATIRNYGTVLDRMKADKWRFAVLGVPPAGKQQNIYKYPFYGSETERVEISRNFNQKLYAFCKKHRYPFIDIWKETADSSGMLKPSFARDEIHLCEKIVPYVAQKLDAAFGTNHTSQLRCQ